MNPPIVHCSKCGKPYPHTPEFFRWHGSSELGKLRKMCRKCSSKSDKKNYDEKPEHYRESGRKRTATRRKKHHETVLQATRDWKATNRTHIQTYNKNYRTQNPERGRIDANRRRARQVNLPDSLTQEDWQYALSYFGRRCAVCGISLDSVFIDAFAAADHWIPLSDPRPDNPGTVSWNIVPLCQGVDGCNNSKHNRDPEAWLYSRFEKRKARAILKTIHAYFQHVRELRDR